MICDGAFDDIRNSLMGEILLRTIRVAVFYTIMWSITVSWLTLVRMLHDMRPSLLSDHIIILHLVNIQKSSTDLQTALM